MRTVVVLDFETVACAQDPLAAAGDDVGGRVRASLAWAAARASGTTTVAVAVDAGFRGLVEALVDEGHEVAVVSDGIGTYAEEECAGLPVTVFANRIDASTGDVVFPFAHFSCACSTCGICKQALLKDARRAGVASVLVSGRSTDHKAALLATRVVARGGLAEWCERAGVAHTTFRTPADVRRALLPG